MQILGSYTYVLECCLYWQRPSYCRFHQNFTRWRILSAKGEMLHWSTNSYSSLSPRSTSLHPAVLIVWGTQHGTHSFFLRELCGDTVWTENRIMYKGPNRRSNKQCIKMSFALLDPRDDYLNMQWSLWLATQRGNSSCILEIVVDSRKLDEVDYL